MENSKKRLLMRILIILPIILSLLVGLIYYAVNTAHKNDTDFYLIKNSAYQINRALKFFYQTCGRYPLSDEGLIVLKSSHQCGYIPNYNKIDLKNENNVSFEYDSDGMHYKLFSKSIINTDIFTGDQIVSEKNK